jgi:gamma-glutamylcyclotransferase (GGCT)/AIG2-like uncharacterized protein YtfP
VNAVSEASADQALFSYGTLQRPAVQLDTFGRLVEGEDDVLAGYTSQYVDIDDPRVVQLSGAAVHSVLRATGNDLDKVVGKVLWITEDELDAADEYEVSLYRRARVTLASGLTAWAYLAVATPESGAGA